MGELGAAGLVRTLGSFMMGALIPFSNGPVTGKGQRLAGHDLDFLMQVSAFHRGEAQRWPSGTGSSISLLTSTW